MNTHSKRARFKNFRIILNSGSSSTILMGKLMSKLKSKETAETNWETQAGNFRASKNVSIDFCLPEFSATNIVAWKCHVDESNNGRYDMILGRYLLTSLGLYIKFFETSSLAEKEHTKFVWKL